VLILNSLGGFSTLSSWTALAFLYLRIAHAAGLISGLANMLVKPMIFAAWWVCCLLMPYAGFKVT
jgi:hypothetical protein